MALLYSSWIIATWDSRTAPGASVADLRVFLFTLGLALITGLLFEMAPAWQASNPDLNESLKAGSASAMGGAGQHRLRHSLVIAEMALAFMLLRATGGLKPALLFPGVQ